MGRSSYFLKKYPEGDSDLRNRRDGELTFVDLTRCLKYGFHFLPPTDLRHIILIFYNEKMPPRK